MKLALLGDDDKSIRLARAAIGDGGRQLVWCGDLSDRAETIEFCRERGLAPRDDWESLTHGVADAVIVAAAGGLARDDAGQVLSTAALIERRAEQLRRLAQAGVAACVTGVPALGPLVCFELDMIRTETAAPIVAYLPERLHPAFNRLALWLRASPAMTAADSDNESPIGEIEQIWIERGVAAHDPPVVLAALAGDVDVVRSLVGDLTRISAVGAPPAAVGVSRDFVGLSVHLTAQRGPAVRWTVDRDLAAGEGRLTCFGGRGRGVLKMSSSDQTPWTLTTSVNQTATSRASSSTAESPRVASSNEANIETSVEEFRGWSPSHAVLAELEAAHARRVVRLDWLDAARAVDTADLVEISLRRGRTIDVYNETYSEQGAFKGLMGMAGCGLLLLALGVLLAAAVGQKAARFAGFEGLAALLGNWHYGLLAILVTFLLLQLFRYAAPDPSRRATNDERKAVPKSGEDSSGN